MKSKKNSQNNILIVEDDEDDYFLIKEAMEMAHMDYRHSWVKDGEELMNYLHRLKKGGKDGTNPSLIILDLNLPKKSGREALSEIKSNPELRSIPVLILTTSNAKEDISRSYDLGVNSFVQKPLRFEQMVEFFSVMNKYWFHFVKLPQGE